MKQLYLIWLMALFSTNPFSIYSQCRITHLIGTVNYNGIDVTVSEKGSVDTTSYCDNKLGPYWPGVHYAPLPSSCSTGSYSFAFSPPVNEAFLNFGSVNSDPGFSEIIRIYINGAHYPMSQVGDTLPCQQLAILTPNGDIASPNWDIAGWEGTKITGVISTLTVEDSVIIGCGNGAVFSLSLCNWPVETTDIELNENFLLSPNPVSTTLRIESASLKREDNDIALLDLTGRVCFTEKYNASAGVINIDTRNLLPGMYLLKVNGVVKKVLKE